MYTLYHDLRFTGDYRQYSWREQDRAWAAYTIYNRAAVHELSVPATVFNIILRGEKRMYEGPHVHQLRAGDCFLIPAGALLCSEILWQQGSYESLNIVLSDELLASLLPSGPAAAVPRMAMQLPAFVAGEQLGRQLQQCFLTGRVQSRAAIAAAVLRLLGSSPQGPAILAMLRQPVKPPLAAALATFREELPELRQLDEIARKCHTSKASLRRYFREIYHTTPMQYLWQKRLELAGFRLRTTSQPVKDIAYGAGFEDISHFYHAFRELHGISPQRWRS